MCCIEFIYGSERMISSSLNHYSINNKVDSNYIKKSHNSKHLVSFFLIDCEQKCDAFDDLGKSKSNTAVIIVVCILLILLSSLILFLICLRRFKQQKLNKKHNEAYLDPAIDNYPEVVRYNGNRAQIDDGHQEQKAQVGRRLPAHPPVENETDGVIYTVSNSVVPDTGVS